VEERIQSTANVTHIDPRVRGEKSPGTCEMKEENIHDADHTVDRTQRVEHGSSFRTNRSQACLIELIAGWLRYGVGLKYQENRKCGLGGS